MTTQPTPQDGNGNVIRLRIEHLERDCKELNDWKDNLVLVSKTDFDELKKQVDTMKEIVITLRERLTIFQLLQTVYTTIAGTIAAIMGRQ